MLIIVTKLQMVQDCGPQLLMILSFSRNESNKWDEIAYE